ncbi:3-oxoacyl-[acyl-carrier-protein] synthase III C-terminal domain-containing protein [Methylomicrobium lacus]|uniref:3-oxoacyl-[acyl-carrier-protein] synthase III C-terminal domain-containing protein n=1 Tax=Methylomicrobium lacus TaxID=136992 RepID=UPI0035A82114
MTLYSQDNAQWVGIKSVGCYLPDQVMTSHDMAQLSAIPPSVFADKIGIVQKPIAGADEHPSQMGVKAAVEAIEKAGLTPSEIDLIAYCGAGDYDYRFWSPAAKIQSEIGASGAFAFEVRNFCNSGNLGIHICRNMLLADASYRYALVVCSDKLSHLLNYSDPACLSTFIMADGAAAVVLEKGGKTSRILAYHGMTDGSLADFLKISAGGTRVPYDAERCSHLLNVDNPEELERIFSELYLKNYQLVVKTSLEKSGYGLDDVHLLLTNQVKKTLAQQILKALGMKENQTLSTLSEFGHLGPVDTLLGLAKSLELGKIAPGNIVVLASSAAGFSWAALTLQWLE